MITSEKYISGIPRFIGKSNEISNLCRGIIIQRKTSGNFFTSFNPRITIWCICCITIRSIYPETSIIDYLFFRNYCCINIGWFVVNQWLKIGQQFLGCDDNILVGNANIVWWMFFITIGEGWLVGFYFLIKWMIIGRLSLTDLTYQQN